MKVKLLFLLILITFGILISLGFINFYNSIKNYSSTEHSLVQGVAVLTGGRGRIAKGIKSFKNNPSSYLIISGVNKKIKNIEVIPEELLESDKVFIDRKSETTMDNAEEIIKWSLKNNITTINIITSDYHMPRSMLILQKIKKFKF